MDSNKAIRIGKDDWINWIEFYSLSVQPLDIDDLIDPMKNFWKKLETACMAECCGIGAFSFWPEDIKEAAKEFESGKLISDLEHLINKLSIAKDEVVISERLNQLINREVFLELLKHIFKNI